LADAIWAVHGTARHCLETMYLKRSAIRNI
jgi:hypothetical protein